MVRCIVGVKTRNASKPCSSPDSSSPVKKSLPVIARTISRNSPADFSFLISFSSITEGLRLPEGWLWLTIIDEAFTLRASWKITFGSAMVPVVNPKLDELRLP